jgi:hypothetical protein
VPEPTTPATEALRQRIETALEECRTLIPAALADALLPLVAAERADARADGLREAAEEADRAAGLYAQRGDNDRAGAAFALMERLKAKADGCSFPPCDADEPCAQHEQDPARAAAIRPQDGGQA